MHRDTRIKLKWYSEGPLTTILHMTVSVKYWQTLVGGPWTNGGLMLDFACYIRLSMAFSPFSFRHISNSQIEWLVKATPSLFVKFILLLTFTNTHFRLAAVQWNKFVWYQFALICPINRFIRVRHKVIGGTLRRTNERCPDVGQP